MISRNDFLVEILTEELPPKALSRLGENFLATVKQGLQQAGLEFDDAVAYTTPRRLAVMAHNLVSEQPTQTVERKGPALTAAYDSDGKPTPACLGFARSCGISPDALMTMTNKQGEWVAYNHITVGKSAAVLLPGIIQQALAALPIPKRMRWGSGTVEFVRPVLAVSMLYGNDVIAATVLGCHAGRTTYGHRVHAPQPLEIAHPRDYLSLLENSGHVIADFMRRKAMIRSQMENMRIPPHCSAEKEKNVSAHVLISEDLLDEVTGLVEWPVAICGQFDPVFLALPAEVLISSMQDHQRYFPVVND